MHCPTVERKDTSVPNVISYSHWLGVWKVTWWFTTIWCQRSVTSAIILAKRLEIWRNTQPFILKIDQTNVQTVVSHSWGLVILDIICWRTTERSYIIVSNATNPLLESIFWRLIFWPTLARNHTSVSNAITLVQHKVIPCPSTGKTSHTSALHTVQLFKCFCR